MKPTDLQLNAHEIPDAGLVMEGQLPADWVASSLLPPYRAASPLALELEVTRMGDNVLVRGTATITLAFECSRTLAPATATLDVPFAELFVEGTKNHVNLAETEVSSDDLVDDEPWVIEGGKIDLEDLIREHVVLAQDPYPLAPGVSRLAADDEEATDIPAWSSRSDDADPRWERLKDIKLD